LEQKKAKGNLIGGKVRGVKPYLNLGKATEVKQIRKGANCWDCCKGDIQLVGLVGINWFCIKRFGGGKGILLVNANGVVSTSQGCGDHGDHVKGGQGGCGGGNKTPVHAEIFALSQKREKET